MKKEIIKNCELYLGDCMDLMSTIPEKYFDLAIVDPPYFKGPSSPDFFAGKLNNPYRSPGRYLATNHWEIPNNTYYKELLRVSKDQIIWGINYLNFKNVPPGRIVWDKKKDSSSYSDGEIASCSLIKSVRFFRYLWNGFLQENAKNREKRIHPTQKPIVLYKWLLLQYAKQGFKILDTHLGSGSIAVACNDMGYSLIASEKDENIYNAACERVKIAAAQNTFNFEPEVAPPHY